MPDFEFNAVRQAQYEALTTKCGFVDLAHRTQIEITGSDRITFLHNLCTNDSAKLSSGEGCEAYITTVKGKILAHVFVFCTPSSLILEASHEVGSSLMTHLDRYIITEDVQLQDRTMQWRELFVSGANAITCLASIGGVDPPAENCAHAAMKLDDYAMWVRRVPISRSPSFLVGAATSTVPMLIARLQAWGGVECAEEIFHSVRIESGFPWFPLDIDADNLPQEAARDEQTISFTKGCYLGQETVARLDALGHVNRILTGLKIDAADLPKPDSELTHEGQSAGRVTSAAFSPQLDAPVAMAMVRSSLAQPATRLDLGTATAEVIELPLDR